MLKGIGYGAAAGVAGGIGLNILGGIFTIFTAGMFGGPAYVGLLACAAVGAGMGVVVGATSAWENHSEYHRSGEVIPGTVVPRHEADGVHLTFHPYDRLEQKVDLKAYADNPGGQGCDPWWKGQGYVPIES